MIGLTTEVTHKIYTMCMIQDGSKVLLMNRPNRKGFPGYIAPGGKVEFPESIVNGAIREVKEETGLTVKEIVFKGIDEYCDPSQGLRYMVFNYLATATEGELLKNPPEGELLWVDMKEALNLPMQDWFKRRFPLFFEPGTFEVSFVWLADTDETLEATIKSYGV
ncbi:DNA mismatch repair protein MutT [Paenibacillus peoriae]|jgi:8-oxo-dGTP diphosphatase|uniref:8-oxo-dGTP diphosphatase n=1 Tax=Paenibacillus TaxID=44249 RepID=UPI0006A70A9D|nr:MULTISPECIES: 8-oxo-dGTP diphosphatase [Paenibacillus]ALA41270.1 DNA mismatch repair protein MutT [Paenibacillus peoriae]APB76950.1 NAD(+) diphosphatase [Paenibacillus polymyxa]MXO79152.1 NUDIX domain-containing protein [Paenibacillus sp. OT2-17]POR30134.1 8-oxo-dGTP diphosphatase [Paenibacillus polymyxa]URJ46540.1 8-oxo-dGTP diphosphatase [Paenibacillus polymyxa]